MEVIDKFNNCTDPFYKRKFSELESESQYTEIVDDNCKNTEKDTYISTIEPKSNRNNSQPEEYIAFESPLEQSTTTSVRKSSFEMPSYNTWLQGDTKNLNLSDFSIGHACEQEKDKEDHDHKKDRLNSFCLDDSNRCEIKKLTDEPSSTVAQAQSTGLVVKIDQAKINNNIEGAVTIQNNMANLLKKKKMKYKEDHESHDSNIACENGVQYMNDIISNISNPEQLNLANYKIGSLTLEERKQKILKYKEKRMRRTWSKKISYDCRKRVADNRLRVKGRFVTRNQAFSLLGMTAQDLCENESIKQLLTDANCSIVTTTNNVKIRNIQTLLQVPKDKPIEEVKPNGIDVEIVSQNKTENTVEIKIKKKKKCE